MINRNNIDAKALNYSCSVKNSDFGFRIPDFNPRSVFPDPQL